MSDSSLETERPDGPTTHPTWSWSSTKPNLCLKCQKTPRRRGSIWCEICIRRAYKIAAAAARRKS